MRSVVRVHLGPPLSYRKWKADLYGGIAQLGERLPCKQEVAGSIPTISTKTIEAGRLLRIDESVQGIERLHLVSKGTGNCTLKTEQCIKCDEKQGNREVFQRNLEESCEF